jgi:hypothetical protein
VCLEETEVLNGQHPSVPADPRHRGVVPDPSLQPYGRGFGAARRFLGDGSGFARWAEDQDQIHGLAHTLQGAPAGAPQKPARLRIYRMDLDPLGGEIGRDAPRRLHGIARNPHHRNGAKPPDHIAKDLRPGIRWVASLFEQMGESVQIRHDRCTFVARTVNVARPPRCIPLRRGRWMRGPEGGVWRPSSPAANRAGQKIEKYSPFRLA